MRTFIRLAAVAAALLRDRCITAAEWFHSVSKRLRQYEQFLNGDVDKDR